MSEEKTGTGIDTKGQTIIVAGGAPTSLAIQVLVSLTSSATPEAAMREAITDLFRAVRQILRGDDDWWNAIDNLGWLLRSEDPIEGGIVYETTGKGCPHCGCKKQKKVRVRPPSPWGWVPECTECKARGPVADDLDGPGTLYQERVEAGDEALDRRIRFFERRARETIDLLNGAAQYRGRLAEGHLGNIEDGPSVYSLAAMADVLRHLLAEGGDVEADDGSGS